MGCLLPGNGDFGKSAGSVLNPFIIQKQGKQLPLRRASVVLLALLFDESVHRFDGVDADRPDPSQQAKSFLIVRSKTN